MIQSHGPRAQMVKLCFDFHLQRIWQEDVAKIFQVPGAGAM